MNVFTDLRPDTPRHLDTPCDTELHGLTHFRYGSYTLRSGNAAVVDPIHNTTSWVVSNLIQCQPGRFHRRGGINYAPTVLIRLYEAKGGNEERVARGDNTGDTTQTRTGASGASFSSSSPFRYFTAANTTAPHMGGKGTDVRPVGAVAFYSAFLAYHRFYDENNTESVWAGGTPGTRSVVCVCVQLYKDSTRSVHKEWQHS